MRNSIIVLFLLINFGLHAFQPTAKKQITQQELAQEMQSPESYLSLLPPDLKQKIKKNIYPGRVEDEITVIRKKYLTSSDPEIMLKFLNDEEFNKKIIDELPEQFNLLGYYAVYIPIMLNTPSSFKIVFKHLRYLSRDTGIINFRNFYLGYQQYLAYASLDCEELLNYTDFFISNMQDLKNVALQHFSRWNLNPVAIRAFQEQTAKNIQDQIDDIKWTLQQRLNFEANKEGGWTCVVQ